MTTETLQPGPPPTAALDAVIDRVRDDVLEVIGSSFASSLEPGIAEDQAVGLAGDIAIAPAALARRIDHTLLRPDATPAQIEQLCAEALEHRFAAVCVNGVHVGFCGQRLGPVRDIAICAVVAFPLGAMTTKAKAYEAVDAVHLGASEIDMVMHVGALKARLYRPVLDDIRGVVELCRSARIKVIIEAGALTEEEKVAACLLVKAAGAHFVKTSTGFGAGGATVADVALMRRVVGSAIGVKASGGIRTREQALSLVAAGATRLGTSAGVAIVSGEAGVLLEQ